MKTKYTHQTLGKPQAWDASGKPIRGKKLKQISDPISQALKRSFKVK